MSEKNPYRDLAQERTGATPASVPVESATGTTVEFDLTVDDWLEFSLEDYRRGPLFAAQVRKIHLSSILTVLVLGLFLWVSVETDAEDRMAVYGGFVGGLVAAVVFVLRAPSRLIKQFEKNARTVIGEGANRGVLGPRRIELCGDGVYCESESGHGFHRWWAVERIERYGKMAGIYVGANTAIMVSQRPFGSEEDFDGFLENARRMKSAAGSRPEA